jgi:hypothetical protein
MSDVTLSQSGLMPSATPTEPEPDIAEWQALPRDEQLRRLRQALAQADVDTVNTATLESIRERGRTKAAAQPGLIK